MTNALKAHLFAINQPLLVMAVLVMQNVRVLAQLQYVMVVNVCHASQTQIAHLLPLFAISLIINVKDVVKIRIVLHQFLSVMRVAHVKLKMSHLQ